jgi:hypothetical protein
MQKISGKRMGGGYLLHSWSCEENPRIPSLKTKFVLQILRS